MSCLVKPRSGHFLSHSCLPCRPGGRLYVRTIILLNLNTLPKNPMAREDLFHGPDTGGLFILSYIIYSIAYRTKLHSLVTPPASEDSVPNCLRVIRPSTLHVSLHQTRRSLVKTTTRCIVGQGMFHLRKNSQIEREYPD